MLAYGKDLYLAKQQMTELLKLVVAFESMVAPKSLIRQILRDQDVQAPTRITLYMQFLNSLHERIDLCLNKISMFHSLTSIYNVKYICFRQKGLHDWLSQWKNILIGYQTHLH